MSARNSKNHYVIEYGPFSGLYADWNSIRLLRKEDKRQRYIKYSSLSKAALAFGTDTVHEPLTKNSIKEKRRTMRRVNHGESDKVTSGRTQSRCSIETDIEIFCDGACRVHTLKISGVGVAVYRKSKLSQLFYGCCEEDSTSNRSDQGCHPMAALNIVCV